jgi:hypothetical protein
MALFDNSVVVGICEKLISIFFFQFKTTIRVTELKVLK